MDGYCGDPSQQPADHTTTQSVTEKAVRFALVSASTISNPSPLDNGDDEPRTMPTVPASEVADLLILDEFTKLNNELQRLRQSKKKAAPRYAALLSLLDRVDSAAKEMPAVSELEQLRVVILLSLIDNAPAPNQEKGLEDQLLISCQRVISKLPLAATPLASPPYLGDTIPTDWQRVLRIALKRRDNPPAMKSFPLFVLNAALQQVQIPPHVHKTWPNAINKASKAAVEILAQISGLIPKEVIESGCVQALLQSAATCCSMATLQVLHDCTNEAQFLSETDMAVLTSMVVKHFYTDRSHIGGMILVLIYSCLSRLLANGQPISILNDVRVAIALCYSDLADAVRAPHPPMALSICAVLTRLAAGGHQALLLQSTRAVQALFDAASLKDVAALQWAVNRSVGNTEELFVPLAGEVCAVIGNLEQDTSLRNEATRLAPLLFAAASDSVLTVTYVSEGFSQMFACIPGALVEHKRLMWLAEVLVRRAIALCELRDNGLGAVLYELSTNKAVDSSIAVRALQQLKLLPSSEASLVSCIARSICTRACTGEAPVCQLLYECETCGLHDGLVACSACVLKCHAGHLIGERIMGVGYCDCKATCKDQCIASQDTRP